MPGGAGRISIQGARRVDCDHRPHALLARRDQQHKNIATAGYAEPKVAQRGVGKFALHREKNHEKTLSIMYSSAFLICRITITRFCLCIYQVNMQVRQISFSVCKMPSNFCYNILFKKKKLIYYDIFQAFGTSRVYCNGYNSTLSILIEVPLL